MRTISIKGVLYAYESVKNLNNADVQALLAGCHRQADARPLCMCKSEGIPLQVRKLDGIFHLARMPDQGLSHDKDCNFYGETTHSDSSSGGERLSVSFPLQLNKPAVDGDVSLNGLLGLLWTRANLHRWSNKNRPRGWADVVKYIYQAAQGLKLNNTPISQLLWVLPSINDEDKKRQISDGCINFVRSCNANGQLAIIIAPIGTSTFFKGSYRMTFRNVEQPQMFAPAVKFPFSTETLRFSREHPFPVAITLVSAPEGKFYLKAHDIAMLWMTSSYLPCSTKDRTKLVSDIMDSSEYMHVPLDIEGGELKDEYAVVRKDGNFKALKAANSPIQPWHKAD